MVVCQQRLLVDQVVRLYLDTQLLYPIHSPDSVHGWNRLFCFDIGIIALWNERKRILDFNFLNC